MQILPYLDLVGMDIKLPSVSGETHWEQHRDFLSACVDESVEVFVKIIISQTTHATELQQAARLVADRDNEIVVFLQSMTALEPTPA
jgi:7-carboxy-7-deazaguanine synthase